MKNTTMKSFDPSNGELLGEITCTSLQEIEQIVSQAKSAQKLWRKTPIEERVRIVSEAYEKTAHSSGAVSELLAREMGKDIRRATGETSGARYMGQQVFIHKNR